ncbi:MAG: EF-P lysine aminoacylase EpmA [Marinobacter sp.]|uniref:EF-P lysine aminoacylase EpmA n=1 Tax=Marinobacter sp. TaxID=50741 RepID=UPI00299D16E8|nr:EF-P lysine aminoacylase EpmA [Marinobacter sp.]MDX1635519.1 EF-P lysine aminoacylase EpmA [Marinobacter sp.]
MTAEFQSHWSPTASLEALKSRAEQSAFVRGFFAGRGVLEVETPVLGRHGVSDLNLDGIAAEVHGAPGWSDTRAWLQTSPEYHMKRLLAAGSGPVFQIARAFRDGERGRRHNPEFSLLEWYRPGFDDDALMAEVADLVCGWLGVPWPQRLSYRQACRQFAGLDPFAIGGGELAARCEVWVGADMAESLGRDECLDLVMSHAVEPALRAEPPTFIDRYPASQAALARTSREDGVEVAHRFELYVRGIELCNGYWELTDPAEQRRRFETDNALRRQAGKREMAPDAYLLAALEEGLPDCAGVALGLDRLLMLKLGLDDIARVMAFPVERA